MTSAAQLERGPELPPSRAARSHGSQRAFVVGSPASIVFGGAPRPWSHVLAGSSVATLLLYALAGWAISRADWQTEPKVVTPPMVVELLAPPPPPPPPPAPEPPPEPPPVVKPAKVVERIVEKVEKAPPPAEPPPEPSNTPPPPAEAGQVVAADAPADFTNFDIAAGQGRYRGGVTASSGTNTRAVHSAVVDRNAPPGSGGGNVSLAQPVRLEVRNWVCPWPEQADLLAVDEERVVLKVDVDAEGRVTAASVVTDPGYGFGAAALRCARQHRFLPATDVAGRPIAASSPPIRVRFAR